MKSSNTSDSKLENKKKKHVKSTNRAAMWVPNDMAEECRMCKSIILL
jgi:hypothetical protein